MKKDNKNNILILFAFIFIILVLLYLYQRYQGKLDREYSLDDYTFIQQYLLSDKVSDKTSDKEVSDKLYYNIEYKLKNYSKPILWIYINYEYNSRKWASFGSRSSYDLNEPYLYLTVKSIIQKCNDSFHICLIDDNSFIKLLPKWKINMNIISNPIKSNLVDLGITKLIYKYGGMRVPPSFICMKNLNSLYDEGTKHNYPFFCETVNRNISSIYNDFCPSLDFMGANKKNSIIGHLIHFMEKEISQDYTDEIKFLGSFDTWCLYYKKHNKINIIDGSFIGTKTTSNKQILIDDLLTNNYIEISKNIYGIYIPEKELMKRINYNWFIRMSPKQVLQGNMIISKYLLLANKKSSKPGIIESLKNVPKPKWVSFWKVPSAAPVWGLKPVDLGENVPRENYPENISGP
jgi:hypothetical protein